MKSNKRHNIMLLGSALYSGGAERVIANLARYLDRDRFKVTICHLMNRGDIGIELANAGYDVVGVPRRLSGPKRYLSFLELRRIVRERNIDLIHSHSTYALFDGALTRLTTRNVKLLNTFHYGNYPNFPRHYMLMERIFSRVADRLVAVGVEQRNVVCATYRLPPARIDFLPNGVETPASLPDPEWQQRLAKTGRLVIGTICTFIEQKGLPDLVETAARLIGSGAPVVFVVVGDGPLRPQIEAQCRELGIAEHVLFAGWKTNASATMMPLFDIFFQPSLWEAMSMVVLEAMMATKPVVVTNVGDNRHVVIDGTTGFVVPKRDIGAMTDALRRLIDSPELRATFGAAAHARFGERYTAQAMARRHEDLYTAMLEGKGSQPQTLSVDSAT